MKYLIVYSSRTGNTRQLAEAIREMLPEEDCLYYGQPGDEAVEKAEHAGLVFAGFWTDRGSCDAGMADFLQKCGPKYFFLFGTAGFGGSDAYYGQILGNVRKNLSGAARLLGSFVCQGQMPDAVRQRYQAMEPSENRDRMLDNFDRAVGHPDAVDIARLKEAVRGLNWTE